MVACESERERVGEGDDDTDVLCGGEGDVGESLMSGVVFVCHV